MNTRAMGNPDRASLGGEKVEVSILIPVGDFYDNLAETHASFRASCRSLGRSYEFIYVVRGDHPSLQKTLQLLEQEPEVRILQVPRTYNESFALNEGLRMARGQVVLTLPAYDTVVPEALADLVMALDDGTDCAVAVRAQRRDPLFNRIQAWVFHALVSRVAGRPLRDITNGAQAIRGEVARRLTLYGEQHRYVPILLLARGCSLKEVEVAQSPRERKLRMFGPRIYINRLLDLAAIFFLLRFTQRPLRFFGVFGAGFGVFGLAICAVVSYQKLFGGQSLADRPALLLGVLLIVLGLQTGSLGLLGELMVHLEAQRTEEPGATEEITPSPGAGTEPPPAGG